MRNLFILCMLTLLNTTIYSQVTVVTTVDNGNIVAPTLNNGQLIDIFIDTITPVVIKSMPEHIKAFRFNETEMYLNYYNSKYELEIVNPGSKRVYFAFYSLEKIKGAINDHLRFKYWSSKN